MNTLKKIDVEEKIIDISAAVTRNKKKDRINSRIVSEEDYFSEIHSADAITSEFELNELILALYNQHDYDTMIFLVVGVNIGYRPVDILAWRWSQITENGKVLKTFVMPEHKTGKTAIVHLNKAAIAALEWYYEYKKANEPLFSEENFVFTIIGKQGRKSYVYYEKERDMFWHSDQKYKSKGLMYSYSDGEIVVCDERVILDDTSGRFIKLQKPVDTDSISRHYLKVAKKVGIKLHLSSYTIRQTFSYWFRHTLKTDDTLEDVADNYFSTVLLSNYFNHSSMKITQKHYMRDQQKLFTEVVNKMNIGLDPLNCVIAWYNESNGNQTTL